MTFFHAGKYYNKAGSVTNPEEERIMNNDEIYILYRELIEDSKHAVHGYWKIDDFKEWGKRALKLIDDMYGVRSTYYTTFLRTHHEAVVMGSNDARFGTHVSLCISILKSAYKEFAWE